MNEAKLPEAMAIRAAGSICLRCGKRGTREFRGVVPYNPQILSPEQAHKRAERAANYAARLFLRKPLCSTCEAAISNEEFKALMGERRKLDREAFNIERTPE